MTKINILSQGRFHMLDLARELDHTGFDIKFYSFIPTSRCIKFGLQKKCIVSLFGIIAPFLILRRIFPKLSWIHIKVQDFIMGIFMRKCDICISLTGYVYAPRIAQKKGAIIIMERGSKHILEQKKILEKNPHKKNEAIPNRNIKCNLKAYQFANFISVASQHVKESFLLHQYPENRIFVNPYGVDLSMFKPLPNIPKKYDVIMVGGWGYEKGCDLIVEAIRKTNYSFIHVGSIKDVDFPQEKNFTHIDPVDQSKLIEYYNQAKVFILPSRQDGFGMVLSQALACNLPIIGSNNCGAPNLKKMVELPEYITIIKDYTADAIVTAIHTAIKNYEQLGERIYAGNAIENLTWEAYGKRYANFLHKIIKQ